MGCLENLMSLRQHAVDLDRSIEALPVDPVLQASSLPASNEWTLSLGYVCTL